MKLADCVSGAMVMALAERAREKAFARDLGAAAANPSGVSGADVESALDDMTAEAVVDSYALGEYVARTRSTVVHRAAPLPRAPAMS